MWRALYTLALRAAAPLVIVRLWWRGRREPGYRRRWGERFSFYRAAPPAQRRLWLHAVSVGEARASAGLVRALAAAYPGYRVLITCMTAAGREALEALHGESVEVAWLPYDYPGAVRRFLGHYRPRLGILIETEVWPNLLAACREFGVPMLLANARMSEKSARGYRRWNALARPALGALAAVCAQSAADAARLQSLGAARIRVAGNLKFDSAPDDGAAARGRAWRASVARPVLLLASTREGEERILLDALRDAPSDLLVLVVPRHPRRFDEVAALALSRRSRDPLPAPGDRVHLGDSMGEMDFYYAASDVAVIGGSFVPLGGQNLIEACAAGVPVVAGPSMFNFTEATRLALEAGAALQAVDAPAAMREALRLLADPGRRAAMGEAGKKLCAEHRGATARHVDACKELLRAAARG